jgi:hypothetical protein
MYAIGYPIFTRRAGKLRRDERLIYFPVGKRVRADSPAANWHAAISVRTKMRRCALWNCGHTGELLFLHARGAVGPEAHVRLMHPSTHKTKSVMQASRSRRDARAKQSKFRPPRNNNRPHLPHLPAN